MSDLENNLLQVFPNPSSGIVNVHSNELIEDLEVFDLYGKKLMRLNSSSKQAQIDMNQFATGNYIIQAKFATGTVKRKISIY